MPSFRYKSDFKYDPNDPFGHMQEEFPKESEFDVVIIGGESRLAFDPGVDNVHVASKFRCTIFVVANQRRVVRDHGTVGTSTCVVFVKKISPVFSPHVGQE